MTAASQKSQERRAPLSRERVLEAARRLMHEGGPTSVTYSALTRESGVGRATLYRHWPSLDDLWPELIRETATSAMFEPSGDLRTDLVSALRLMADHMGSNGGLVQLLTMLERAQWDEQTATLLRMTEEHNPIRQIMARANEANSVGPAIDADLAVPLLTGPLLQWLMFGGTIDDPFLESVVDSYLDGPLGPGGQAEARRS